jgi:multiple sugar transport system ATP-binding protein
MSSIQLTEIRKSFGEVEVLRNVSLEIREGEFVTLVGPSGCGKSTLLRILAGLESPDRGVVEIDGKDATDIRASERNLAMVFQSYALYPHLTVRENLATPLRLRDLAWIEQLPLFGRFLAPEKLRAIDKKVRETAEALQIQQLLDRKPGQLSGGQRQRTALGRAMVRDPQAFLMDEPLSNLDAALRVHMRSELSELHRRLGTTFVYVTHDQAEALTMSDRLAVMHDGRILQVGPPDAVYDDPDTLQVARFIGSPAINLMAGEIDGGGRLTVAGYILDRLAARVSEPVTVGIRPEAVRVTAGHQTGIRGIIRHRENLGSDVFLHIEVEGHDSRIVAKTAPPLRMDMSIGRPVTLSFDAMALLLFRSDGSRLRLPQLQQAALA